MEDIQCPKCKIVISGDLRKDTCGQMPDGVLQWCSACGHTWVVNSDGSFSPIKEDPYFAVIDDKSAPQTQMRIEDKKKRLICKYCPPEQSSDESL